MPRIKRTAFRRGLRTSRTRFRKRRFSRSRPAQRNRFSRSQSTSLITRASHTHIAIAEAMVAANGDSWFSEESDTQLLLAQAAQAPNIVAATARSREMAVDSVVLSFLPAAENNGNMAMVISDIGRQVELNTIELLGVLPFAKVRTSKQSLSLKLKIAPHLRRLNRPFWIPSGNINGQNDAAQYLGGVLRPSLYFVFSGSVNPLNPAAAPNPAPRFIGHLKVTTTFVFRGTR